jgi:hypothetical protein
LGHKSKQTYLDIAGDVVRLLRLLSFDFSRVEGVVPHRRLASARPLERMRDLKTVLPRG